MNFTELDEFLNFHLGAIELNFKYTLSSQLLVEIQANQVANQTNKQFEVVVKHNGGSYSRTVANFKQVRQLIKEALNLNFASFA
jgi:hypothetical protein